MKYSVFTVGVPDYDIEQTILKLKKYGYDGVEWRVADALKSEPEKLPPKGQWYWQYNKSTLDIDTIEENAEKVKDICSKNNIDIVSLTTYLQPKENKKIESVLRAAVKMECPRIRVGMPGYNGTMNYNKLFDETIKDYKALEPLAEKYGVKINFELHHGTITSSASAAYRFIQNFDSRYIGVIYDPGNMVHEGFEQYKAGLEILSEYIDHVHLKNANWKLKDSQDKGYSNWECVWSPIDKGQVDLAKFMEALKSIGYDNYLSFEDFSNEKTTDEKLNDNLNFIKSII